MLATVTRVTAVTDGTPPASNGIHYVELSSLECNCCRTRHDHAKSVRVRYGPTAPFDSPAMIQPRFLPD